MIITAILIFVYLLIGTIFTTLQHKKLIGVDATLKSSIFQNFIMFFFWPVRLIYLGFRSLLTNNDQDQDQNIVVDDEKENDEKDVPSEEEMVIDPRNSVSGDTHRIVVAEVINEFMGIYKFFYLDALKDALATEFQKILQLSKELTQKEKDVLIEYYQEKGFVRKKSKGEVIEDYDIYYLYTNEKMVTDPKDIPNEVHETILNTLERKLSDHSSFGKTEIINELWQLIRTHVEPDYEIDRSEVYKYYDFYYKKGEIIHKKNKGFIIRPELTENNEVKKSEKEGSKPSTSTTKDKKIPNDTPKRLFRILKQHKHRQFTLHELVDAIRADLNLGEIDGGTYNKIYGRINEAISKLYKSQDVVRIGRGIYKGVMSDNHPSFTDNNTNEHSETKKVNEEWKQLTKYKHSGSKKGNMKIVYISNKGRVMSKIGKNGTSRYYTIRGIDEEIPENSAPFVELRGTNYKGRRYNYLLENIAEKFIEGYDKDKHEVCRLDDSRNDFSIDNIGIREKGGISKIVHEPKTKKEKKGHEQ